jgi:hypothetical protein
MPRVALETALGIDDPPPGGDPASAPGVRLGSVLVWVAVAGAGLGLLALRFRGLAAGTFAVLALALVTADLLRAGLGYNPAIPEAHADQPVTGSLRLLTERGPARFAGMGDVPQNVAAMRLRLQDARSYDLPILKRYNRLWRREVSPEVPDLTSTLTSLFLQIPRLDERRLRTLRLLGVTDLLLPPEPAGPPASELALPGLRTVYSAPDARVLRVDGALPRTFVTGAQQVVDGEEAALDAVTRPGADLRRVAVTEERLPGVALAPGPAAAAGTARIVRYEPDRVAIDARLSRRGVVVLGDNFYPGWKAKVDGRPAAVERVDYVHRGVVAGPGRHRVEFSYEPVSWRIGWITSLVSLLALAAAVAVARRRGRARGPAPPPPA